MLFAQDTGVTEEADPVAETVTALGSLTVADWLWAAGILAFTIVAAIVVRRVLGRLLEARTSRFVAQLLARFAAGLTFAIGTVYTMSRLGVSVAPVLGALGLLGLAAAFAFQDILENFIAGILMSLRRPFENADQIRTGDFEGTVEDITLRSVTLRTFDGAKVYVPNAMVWKSPITNYTELGARRTTLSVGVAYDTDLDAARDVIIETVRSIEGVRSDPEPEAWVEEFGSSSIDYAVRFWHDPHMAVKWRVRDAVARALKRRFDTEGIEIPFPQRVLHLPNARLVGSDQELSTTD